MPAVACKLGLAPVAQPPPHAHGCARPLRRAARQQSTLQGTRGLWRALGTHKVAQRVHNHAATPLATHAAPASAQKAPEETPLRAGVPQAVQQDEAQIRKLQALKVYFCKQCGAGMELAVPPGEEQLRHVCSSCSFVDYHNPKMVVGCLVEHQGQVLLCRRALEPCSGLWTLPAGFMELGESCARAHHCE